MPGLFNVENALAAIAVCQGLNIPEQAVYVGLMKARVPGRMEVYSNADDTVTAIVDYAHNRMSFETLFRSVQAEYPGHRHRVRLPRQEGPGPEKRSGRGGRGQL